MEDDVDGGVNGDVNYFFNDDEDYDNDFDNQERPMILDGKTDQPWLFSCGALTRLKRPYRQYTAASCTGKHFVVVVKRPLRPNGYFTAQSYLLYMLSLPCICSSWLDNQFGITGEFDAQTFLV